MIAKISNGAHFAGLAAYLHGPGTANEHVHAQRRGGAVIGGNLGVQGDRDGTLWVDLMRTAAATRPDIARPVWHASLRNPEADRVLSDQEWARVGQDFAEAMGFADHPWVAVRHGGDHVHLVLSRVGFDGRVWSRSDDRYRAQRACTAIETQWGLTVAPRQTTAATQRRADHEISAEEWRRALREQTAPGRVVLAEAVRAAAIAAIGRGRQTFEVALGRAGVEHQVNIATTGRISGYRFHLPGHDDAAGAPVWFKASRLDKALAWSRLAPLLEGPVPAPTAQVVGKGIFESRRHHQGRIEQAETSARLATVPASATAWANNAHQWWRDQATERATQAAARALARQRAAAERRARTALAASFPQRPRALTPAELKDLSRELARPRSYQPPTQEPRGPSLGR